MARTRLDEIVEEVLSCWYSQSSPQMPPPTVTFSRDLVASLMATSNEKAFRHGVEQSFEYINNREGASRAVQPAPAGEKPQIFYRNTSGTGYGCSVPDRRKVSDRRRS